MNWFLIFSCIFLFLNPFIHLEAKINLTKQEVKSTLDLIEFHLMTSYAPWNWKKEHHGRDASDEIQQAKAEVEALKEITIKKAQGIVLRLVHRLKDYHVDVLFFSTEAAKLPFAVKGAEGRYFVVSLNPDKLPDQFYQIQCGDELLLFGGRKPSEVINEIKESMSYCAHELTDQSLCERYLTQRFGATLTSEIPKGSIELTFKSRVTDKIYGLELSWEYEPEHVDCSCVFDHCAQLPKEKSRLFNQKFLREEMLFSPATYLQTSTNTIGLNPNNMGERDSFLPTLGKILWKTGKDNPFQAYIFQNLNERKIGFLRIPTYDVEDGEGNLKALEGVILMMEEQTDMLIIDQLSNPGGGVFYSYAIASMLTDKPLNTPHHQKTITQLDVIRAHFNLDAISDIYSNKQAVDIFGKSICGYPVNYQFIQNIINYNRFILNQWHKGNTLTDSFHLWGANSINPHSLARYSKQILLLNNELCFSAADFFAAILEDNGRAKIFGSRTAGAGGTIERIYPYNHLGISMLSFTKTIAYRKNNQPIEDLGVSPHIPYHVTADDVQNGYHGYKKALLQAVAEILDQL